MQSQTMFDGFFRVVRITTEEGFTRDVVMASDSVSIFLYDQTNDRILLVRQIRESQIRDDNPDGHITETVAGRFDIQLGPKALAIKEAQEEAGVQIAESDVTLLNVGVPMALSAGVLSERGYIAYAEIKPAKVEATERVFGTDEGERIQRIWIPIAELEDYVCEDLRVFAFVQWFLRRQAEEAIVETISSMMDRLAQAMKSFGKEAR